MKNTRRKKISYTLLRVVGKIYQLNKQTRYYGTDEKLFEAEIHMIKSIKENEGIHVTGLSEKLEVTKGAVSQIINKLNRKGMVIKNIDPNNLSRLLLRLTPKGEIAYEQHEELHRKFNSLLVNVLEGASEDNKNFLNKFLHSIETQIDNFKDN